MSATTGAADRALALLTGTPGVVSDRVLAHHGVRPKVVRRLRQITGLPIVRVMGLGYRLARKP